jgi:hypothetical protein
MVQISQVNKVAVQHAKSLTRQLKGIQIVQGGFAHVSYKCICMCGNLSHILLEIRRDVLESYLGLLAGVSSCPRPLMLIIATDFVFRSPAMPAYPRQDQDRPRFWTLYSLTSFTKPLSPIGSIHVRTRVSEPSTHRMYCTAYARKQCASSSSHGE